MIPSVLLRPSSLGYLRVAPAAAAGALLAVTAATTNLAAIARTVAIGFLLASVLGATLLKRDEVKRLFAVVCAVIAVALAGTAQGGALYVIGCGLFALVMLACVRAPIVAARLHAAAAATSSSGPGSVTRQRSAPRADPRWGTLGLLVAVMTAVTTALVLALPRASAFAEREVQRLAGNAVMAQYDTSGFATNIRVGSLHHMLLSDRVVMRIDGERVEYLRGIVLDLYDRRVWSSTRSNSTVSIETNAPLEITTTHIELSRAALSGRTPEPRWFLPTDVCNIHTPSGRMDVDAHGSAHPDPPTDAREIWFRRSGTGSCVTTPPSPVPPTGNDKGMSRKIQPALGAIAREWTRGTTTPRQALDAIVLHLAQYEYSLQDRRETEVDPVVAFLTEHRRGHCELFASAMALLARMVGIPTRLVVGYRVGEVNALTGLAVVRDRNAHTWVEAWTGEKWESFDPTPISEVMAAGRSSTWESGTEALSYGWDHVVRFFTRLGLAGTGLVFGTVAVVLILVRRFTQRRAKKTGAGIAASRPLPAFETLATALARAGWVRTESEPLERFARRVDGAGEPWSADVADALDRYAELRYGGIGEERTIAQRLEELARKITPARPTS